MNSGPHLLSEDRQDYERFLDEVLRSPQHRPELTAGGQLRLNIEQLRTMTLNAGALVLATAAAEYDHYVLLREEQRSLASSTALGPGETGSAASQLKGTGLRQRIPAAVLGVRPRRSRQALLTGQQQRQMPLGRRIMAALIGLHVRTLVPQASQGVDAVPLAVKKLNKQVALAREAWHHAILERGILPFLREALADPGPHAQHRLHAQHQLDQPGYHESPHGSHESQQT
ncbi:hypothetical protein [Streptomyces melanogenes]|uniref:hypothetical protein n=1 Tax=Streptomyces melanogenes TaxID=67326 RepID=UPI00378DEE1E